MDPAYPCRRCDLTFVLELFPVGFKVKIIKMSDKQSFLKMVFESKLSNNCENMKDACA